MERLFRCAISRFQRRSAQEQHMDTAVVSNITAVDFMYGFVFSVLGLP